jgi:hypothetical protein
MLAYALALSALVIAVIFPRTTNAPLASVIMASKATKRK